MSKITSKLQVTLPKKLAEQYGLGPGDEIEWVAAGDAIRIVPKREVEPVPDLPRRLESFDAASIRQRRRHRGQRVRKNPRGRGWRREDLYERGRRR